MRYEQAQAVAGQLFGNILLRNADKGGFEYAVERLYKGSSPADLSRELFCSDEFAEKFIINCSLVDVSKQLTRIICGWSVSDQDAKFAAARIARDGVKPFVNELFEKRSKYFPAESIPSMAEVTKGQASR